MSNINEQFFSQRSEMFAALTELCCHSLTAACEDHGSASFMVSGGSTPKPLYQALAEKPLPWANIEVALVDERWVSPTDPSSNQAFIESCLLQHQAKVAQFTPMKTAADTAVKGLAETTARYRLLCQPWDLTILGMGDDGHTASIFPDCQGIEQALDPDADPLLAAITANRSAVTGDNLERITLSLAGLLKSRQLVLLITGEQKLAVYRQALQQTEPNKTPISAVLQQTRVPVHVYWAP